METKKQIKLATIKDLELVKLGENVELYTKVLNSDKPKKLAQGTLIGKNINNFGEIIIRVISELDLDNNELVERTFKFKDFLGNQSFIQYGDCEEKFFLSNKFDIEKRKFDTLA
jgi:hypothetical protein